jgi:hypothetical protein
MSTTLNQQQHTALLSSIASEMEKRLILSDRIKNDILYSNVFDGKEAVVSKKNHIFI